MAQSIRNIIHELNEKLNLVFSSSKFYGVATSVEREGRSQPVVDEKPVSFDDSFAMQMYHKVNSVAITYKPGYGDQQNTINTFAISAIVFNNEKITKLKTDEIAMIIQSVFANIQITSARILPANVILNSQSIFSTEYRGTPYSLSEYASLMQFNYTVEISFKSGCFDLCPGDFSQCKN